MSAKRRVMDEVDRPESMLRGDRSDLSGMYPLRLIELLQEVVKRSEQPIQRLRHELLQFRSSTSPSAFIADPDHLGANRNSTFTQRMSAVKLSLRPRFPASTEMFILVGTFGSVGPAHQRVEWWLWPTICTSCSGPGR